MVYVDRRRVLSEGPTPPMKPLFPLRRLLAVLAVVLPVALLAPAAASAAPPPKPDFDIPTNAQVGEEITFTVKPDAAMPADVVYTWDTDQNPATLQTGNSAKKTYPDSGEKTVVLTATSGVESNSTTKQFTVSEPPPTPAAPVADFSISDRRPQVGETITVTSTTTGTVTSHAWSANGGAPLIDEAGASSTTISFGEAGTWRIRLDVNGPGGPDDRVRTVIVSNAPLPPNQPPAIPSFSFTPERPSVNEVVRFTANASDPDGTIETIEWDFDNDGVVEASGTSVQRVFTTGGTATVTVIVTDDRGAERRAFQTIVVSGPSSNGTARSEGNTTNAPTGSNIGVLSIGNTPNNPGNNNGTVRLLNPIIRLRGSISGGRTKITLLRVYGVPRGAKVRARCRGGGCPRGLITNTAQVSGRSIRLSAFERTLRPGAIIEVYVTQSGRLGKYTKWKVTRTKAPIRTDKCIRSFGKKPSSSPSED
jgi:PKD repeat protein